MAVRHSSCECGTASWLLSRLAVLILPGGPDVLTCSILCYPVGAFRDMILAAITVQLPSFLSLFLLFHVVILLS